MERTKSPGDLKAIKIVWVQHKTLSKKLAQYSKLV
jgi:hypothetical protein